MYAALLVEAIKDIEEDNQASRAELNGIRSGLESTSEDDRTEYMGWVIDDFPGNADQVRVRKPPLIYPLQLTARRILGIDYLE